MKRLALTALALCLALAPGCYDLTELTELGLIESVAIDTSAAGEGYEFTAEFMTPADRGDDAIQGKGFEPWLASADGPTLHAAINHIRRRVSRLPFYQHAEVVVFGRPLAQRGLTSALDLLTRDSRGRRTLRLVVTEGTGREALAATSGLETTAAGALVGLLEIQQTMGYSRMVSLNEFMLMATSEAGMGLLPLVRAAKQPGSAAGEDEPLLEVAGLGIFDGDRLVGTVEGPAARGVLWLRGELGRGALFGTLPGGQVSAEFSGVSSRTRAAFVRGEPAIRVEIQGRLTLLEDGFGVPLVKKVPMMEDLFEAQVRTEVEAALDEVLRGMRADVFGFADALHRSDHRQWQRLKGSWREWLAGLNVEVDVKLSLGHLGLTTTRILFGGP
ncbi:MAG: Ger(x)C family spore germination protein [Bacillota bacterium]